MRTLAFDQSSVGQLILGVDDKFTILDSNKAHNQSTNTRAEDVEGKGVFEAFPHLDSLHGVNLKYSFMKCIHTKQPDRMPILRYDIRCEDGTWEERFWSVENSPIIQNGVVIAILNTALDVSNIAKAINMENRGLSKGMKEAVDSAAAMTQKTNNNIVIIKSRTLIIIIVIFILLAAGFAGYSVLKNAATRGAIEAAKINAKQDSTILSNDKH